MSRNGENLQFNTAEINVKIHYLNLTNGLEAIEKFKLSGKIRFLRIQSSHCEAHKFERILEYIDSDFLMNLALGNHCIVYDFSSDSDIPKALYIGLEWIKYVLCRRWFFLSYKPDVKGKDVENSFFRYYLNLSKPVKRKIDYYKKFLNCKEINLEYVSGRTNHDNEPEYFAKIIKNWQNN